MGQILLLAAGFLVLVAISATSVILVDQAREDSRWVVHTVEVENQISTLLLQVRRAESAARGYLLTSDPRFLAEHERRARRPSFPTSTSFRSLTSDNPVQIENTKRLRAPIQARLEEFAKTIDFVKRNDIAGGIAMLREAGANDSVAAHRRRRQRDAGGRERVVCAAHRDRGPHPAARLHRDGGRLRPRGRAGRDLDLSGAALGPRARRSRSAVARQQSQSGEPRSTNAPPICAKPTTKSSASPISSATTCARRW